ncbi:hypothetical protein Hdeb2414_s0009g00318141 [Helianthus debilis subsp. tardiflorus]
MIVQEPLEQKVLPSTINVILFSSVNIELALSSLPLFLCNKRNKMNLIMLNIMCKQQLRLNL